MNDNTKPSQVASIESDLLAGVQGGCGKRRCCCTKQVNINKYAAPAPAPSGGPSVDVSVGYQQA